jgi:hypothetical protein
MVPKSMSRKSEQTEEEPHDGIFDHRQIVTRESQIKDKRIIIERNKENIKREMAEFFR